MCVSIFSADNAENDVSLSVTSGMVELFQSDTWDEEFNGFSDLNGEIS